MTLAERIERKSTRIAVVGQGYVGLPLAMEFARAGFRVTGLDTDAARVVALAQGRSHIPDVPAGVLWRTWCAPGATFPRRTPRLFRRRTQS